MIEDIVFLENIIDERNDEINALKLQINKLLALLKQEPLSLEELCKLYGDNVVEDIFAFARQVEKAHGIGGGE